MQTNYNEVAVLQQGGDENEETKKENESSKDNL